MSESGLKLKKYNKKQDYTYAFGAFPTIELLKSRPQSVIKLLVHEALNSEKQIKIMQELCNKNNIPYIVASKQVERLRDKENCYVIGVLHKYEHPIQKTANHVVLVNPSDTGNMGTIIRTCIGFGIYDIVVIGHAVDLFHPKVIRASMGAIFHVRFSFFTVFSDYLAKNIGERTVYPFMLKGATMLQEIKRRQGACFTLVFGNEASGLDDEFLAYGQSVYIPHGDEIDSLNLSIALGIGLYEFTKQC